MTKNNLGRNWEFISYCTLQSITENSQRRNTRGQELETEATKEHCSLACSKAYVQLLFLYRLDPPIYGWWCIQWTGLYCINLQSRKCLMDMPTGQSDGDNPSTEVPSSQACQETTKISYHNLESSYPAYLIARTPGLCDRSSVYKISVYVAFTFLANFMKFSLSLVSLGARVWDPKNWLDL